MAHKGRFDVGNFIFLRWRSFFEKSSPKFWSISRTAYQFARTLKLPVAAKWCSHEQNRRNGPFQKILNQVFIVKNYVRANEMFARNFLFCMMGIHTWHNRKNMVQWQCQTISNILYPKGKQYLGKRCFSLLPFSLLGNWNCLATIEGLHFFGASLYGAHFFILYHLNSYLTWFQKCGTIYMSHNLIFLSVGGKLSLVKGVSFSSHTH